MAFISFCYWSKTGREKQKPNGTPVETEMIATLLVAGNEILAPNGLSASSFGSGGSHPVTLIPADRCISNYR